MKIEQTAAVAGEFLLEVLNQKGTVLRQTRKRNMITNNGLANLWNMNLFSWAQFCHVGTGTTPVRDAQDGTYSQTGTTVTRDTGTGTFSAGDVGRVIRWATGEQARITAYTSGTQVTVAENQTVAAAGITKWRTERTALQARVKEQILGVNGGSVEESRNSVTGTHVYTCTYIFPDNTVSEIYTEVGISSGTGAGALMNSIVLLDSPVTVGIGEILRVTYTFTMVDNGPKTPQNVDLDGKIAGWPYTYQIASIASTPTYFDLVTTADHHFRTGGKINIAGAQRPRKAITSIASTVSDFTVTATAHGFSVSDTVIIEESSVPGYNGPWTIASVPTADTFTVTSAANPGPATGGNVRLTNPVTWYDGEWTIASIPNATTVRVSTAMDAGPAGDDGTVKNNLKTRFQHTAYPLTTVDNPWVPRGAFSHANMSIAIYRITDGSNGVGETMPTFLGPGLTGAGRVFAIIAPGETWGINAGFVAYEADNHVTTNDTFGTRTNSCRLRIGVGNFQDIKAMSLQFGSSPPTDYFLYQVAFIWIFEEVQRKDNGWTFTVTLKRKITRSFPA
jgi:hypothetical protein